MFPWQSLPTTRPKRRRLTLRRTAPPHHSSSASTTHSSQIDSTGKENAGVCRAVGADGAKAAVVPPPPPPAPAEAPSPPPRRHAGTPPCTMSPPAPRGAGSDPQPAPAPARAPAEAPSRPTALTAGAPTRPASPPAAQGTEHEPQPATAPSRAVNAFSVLMRPRKRHAPGGEAASAQPVPASVRVDPLAALMQRARAARLGVGAGAVPSRGGGAVSRPSPRPASAPQPAAPGGRRGPKRDGTCPAVKRVPGTRVIVDGFSFACAALSDAYVLTHFHSDHYGGLTRSFDCGTILCTPVTARLAHQRLGVASQRFLRAAPGDRIRFGGCTVDVVDANHCPGAAMFLFHTPSGLSVLHTGDFRYHASMVQSGPLAAYASGERRLDVLMLDTTYCDPRYSFPPQDRCVADVVGAVRGRWAHKATLFVFGTYSIGKERVFMEVARAMDCQVEVPADRLRAYRTYGWGQVDMARLAPASRRAARLRVVPMAWLREDKLRALLVEYGARFRRVVAFRPTGWQHTSGKPRKSRDGVVEVIGVPYSEHSSFRELREAVRVLNPARIVPTVGGRSNTARMVLLDRLRA